MKKFLGMFGIVFSGASYSNLTKEWNLNGMAKNLISFKIFSFTLITWVN